MLDYRLKTFLTLCETCNYTMTAQKLNMTQPAVSQHIQFLENHYQVPLISGKGKNFSLTKEGKALQINISMFVENTHVLQTMLWEGKIDFALLKGHFNQNQFEYKLISNETFIGITFMYREAVKKELSQGYLKEIPIRNFNISHPFNLFI
ncbi:MAG TPA: hypothetical protein DGK91_08950 [Clostridium sp.]|jgi:hypothetical protein|nr:LysR family transcriptional regulator [Clostridia bacterium]HCW04632.1 hypothetical protein [Clostridium sp.]